MNFSVSRININVKNAPIVKDHILFLKQPENIKLLITWQLYAKNIRHKAPRGYKRNLFLNPSFLFTFSSFCNLLNTEALPLRLFICGTQ
jgi:hypothetical protein